MEEVTAYIIARTGSVRITNKNLLSFADTTLLGNKIKQLQASKRVHRVVVGTNGDEIAEEALKHGAEVVRRPDRYCDEKSATPNEMVANMAELIPTDHVLWAHCTNPLTGSQTYDAAVELYLKSLAQGYDSLISMTRIQAHVWFRNAPLNFDPWSGPHPLAITLDPALYQNGSIYMQPHANMLQNSYYYGVRPVFFEIAPPFDLDINDPDEFRLAEILAPHYL
jgi:CMP-N,N'-diacetyllegionaminic acid synthase